MFTRRTVCAHTELGWPVAIPAQDARCPSRSHTQVRVNVWRIDSLRRRVIGIVRPPTRSLFGGRWSGGRETLLQLDFEPIAKIGAVSFVL